MLRRVVPIAFLSRKEVPNMHAAKTPNTTSEEGHAAESESDRGDARSQVASAEMTAHGLRVLFADGLEADIGYAKIGIDPKALDIGSLRRLAGTGGIEFRDAEDESFVVDGATLRYLADPEYALAVDQRIEATRIPAERLDRLLEKSEPPKEWFDARQPELF
jgi:hypothetical protein